MTDTRRLARLPEGLARALDPVLHEARRAGVRIALVGGVVRDRLLGLPAGHDVDVVVEGDAALLARAAAARRIGGDAPRVRVRVHGRFGTATLEPAEGTRIDLASARRERYRRPGALPEVEPATLEEDLARRDFTVHAMAWEPSARRLLDPFHGAEDLAAGRLRVLHGASFEDDPTRILRALRYAKRLGFALEPETRRLARRAVGAGAFDTISGDRIRRELVRLLSEPGWRAAFRGAESLGVPAALEPSWRIPARVRTALARAEALARRDESAGPRAWLAGLLVAASGLEGAARLRLAERLALAGEERRIFESWEHVSWSGAERPRRPSREETIARAALAPPGPDRRRLERALFAPVDLSIRGSDLLRAGVPEGPEVGRALAQTRRALEEGRITPEEQLPFAIAAAHGRAHP